MFKIKQKIKTQEIKEVSFSLLNYIFLNLKVKSILHIQS